MQPLDALSVPCDGVRLIEASAGTGKTYTIATLYLRLLLEQGRSVRDLLVVTFTVAATEELRDRIRERLRAAVDVLNGGATGDALLGELCARVADPAAMARRLTDELTGLDEAAIFTIHGFCQRMLQDNAFESGALFEAEFVSDESELLAEVVRDFWRRRFYAAGRGAAELALATWGTPDALLKQIRRFLGRPELTLRPELDGLAGDEANYRRAVDAIAALWAGEGTAIRALLDEHDGLGRAEKSYRADRIEAACAALAEWLAGPPASFTQPPLFDLFTPARLDAAILANKRKKGAIAPQHPFFDRCAELIALIEARTVALTAEAIAWCRDTLLARKRERGVLAFDDLLLDLRTALDSSDGAGGAGGGNRLAARIAASYPVALIDEFQDTDPAQYRIFDSIYSGRDGCALFLIGDPKQAIYSFRGADVFTYMQAKQATAADARYTLGTNWRSAESLVAAVNALFAGAAAPFIYTGAIDFQPVAAAGRADAEPLACADGLPPLVAWFVPRGDDGKPLSKEQARRELAAACAGEVARLLNAGAAGSARIGEAPLAPRDIAVLVRDHFEAGAVQRALRGVGVPSVYYSRDSVFASVEAQALERLLAAVAAPSDEPLLRAALCDDLIGLSAAELDGLLRDELAWEERVLTFHRYLAAWRERGFMALFHRLLHEQGIAARLLARPEGERALTNLLQLAELLQQASRELPGVEHLLRWFAGQRANPDGNAEDQQLRLESDADLVRIVTVHKSKGLEYPIVFLPFLWGCKPLDGKGPVLFHEEAGGSVLHLQPEASHHAEAERERLAEELRLAYVALTRARHRCYFAWGAFRDAPRSALAWLLHAEEGMQGVDDLATAVAPLADADLRARLEALAAAGNGVMAVIDLPAPAGRYDRPPTTDHRPAVRHPARRVGWDWRVTSYSGLTAGHHAIAERPDTGSRAEDAEGSAIATEAALKFPKGARAGVFLHEVLERLDFTAGDAAVAAEVRRQLLRHGFGTEWQEPVSRWIASVLATPLAAEAPPTGANGQLELGLAPAAALRLCDVAAARRVNELEFHYPLAAVAPATLDAIAAGLGAYGSDGPRLKFEPAAGMLTGFIDLVFEHAGRFYVADYKSNWLGPRVDDYAPERLAAAVAAHRYDLQFLLYAVALHRYLAARLPDYDYARHFGGVYYLFLRGMHPASGPDRGVFFERPEPELIAKLDALLAGGAS